MGASGNLLLSAAAGLLLIACATATATTNEGSVGGAIAEEKDASSALFFRLTYETPPFLSHSTAAARADFRRLWETGVNTLSKKRFEAAVKAWVLSQQDPKLQKAFAAYQRSVQFRVAALQLAAQALSVNASRIWAEVFDPELDTGVSVLKSLERERAVFDSLEAGLREEITGVLTETGEASPTSIGIRRRRWYYRWWNNWSCCCCSCGCGKK